MNKEMDVEPEAPYETPDETATEVPATPAKWSRSDTTDEKLEGSVQCLEPQWMVMRSARAKKTHHSTKVIITYQRRAGGDAVTNATGVAGFRSSCSADADARPGDCSCEGYWDDKNVVSWAHGARRKAQ
ncbi:hypothetical protein HPB50_024166 [Hyalomma asiaticum]|uniref:Uncharacterized protein n=1 Tax=Hyalomma asiaticum TaxID=266040 RepID=A0ACB7SK37_HYAAI|nr:hypothetical protein HPB50_024166 [Hyalomma asiaticum]